MPSDEEHDRAFYEEDLDAAEKAGKSWFSFDDWQKKRAEWETRYHETLRAGLDDEDNIQF